MSETEAYNGVAKLSSCTKQQTCGWSTQSKHHTFRSFFPVHNPEMDDDDTAVATLEERQKRIEKELKKRKLAASRTRKEEEERWLIAAGEGNLANLNIQLTDY